MFVQCICYITLLLNITVAKKIVVKYVLELSQRSKEVVKRGKEYNNHNEDPD